MNQIKHYSNVWLLVLRVLVSGLMLIGHGIPKFQKLFGPDEIRFGDPLGFGIMPTFLLAVFAEGICSILILIGWKVRWAAVPPLITMLVVVIFVHRNDPFGKIELPLLYSLIYATLFVFGSGKYALDHVNRRPGRE
ncbi:MAG TPA: DoxX family protein [Ohtaekwangia sp.]|nr:DoxX family protein [Ohtaekwangia sp.]